MGSSSSHDFDALHERSLRDSEGFWGEAASRVDWFSPWTRVLDDTRAPFSRWFPGATLNTCHNAVDRHVHAGRGDQPAIIHDSPVTGSVRVISYDELLGLTSRLAGALRALGVAKGDRVLIYMPMVPEAIAAMLACARLGAIHSVVFGGFAAPELATRINDAAPRVIVSASCGMEPSRVVRYKPMLDAAIEQSAHKPERCVILQREMERAALLPGRDIDWDDATSWAGPADPVPVLATDPLYILYTSGTTGRPKGVVRDNGGHAVALLWTMDHFYGARPGEVFWSASDIGWVVGHSYIVYAPLLQGCTTIVFEGKPVGTPDAGTFWRVVSQHRVPLLFTAPTALRAIKREDPEGKHIGRYDLSHFRALFLAGERADPDTVRWAAARLNVPVVDHWWQTETGWAIAGNPLATHLFPVKPGSATRAMPGYDLRVLGAGLKEVPRGQQGAIYAKLPLPPGALATLWKAEDECRRSYFNACEGHYRTGDAGFIDEDGYVHVMSRTDDVINVAGHRLSTGEMEGILAEHPDVAECAVVGMADPLKGQVPLGFLVLKAGVTRPPDTIVAEVVRMVRDRIGPVADFKRAVVVDRLPKTRSGKVLRGTMQKIADREDYNVPATIDDASALTEIAEVLEASLPDAGPEGAVLQRAGVPTKEL
ncbi:Acetyl-coenzyme A synthetase [Aquisphaera giovannonii]|uniref:Acetyl-coenzyme A synthetase n=1 Tax=Aquisphaera giovannonii TaxID=406548 RepID=A0A5B9VZI4_9BACT|nr:AMP-binding protein [Aquisphaera giovannonii]QEH33762.1 Acetyl-coenzyme A synthetase [Aquisphaera giovannonii]